MLIVVVVNVEVDFAACAFADGAESDLAQPADFAQDTRNLACRRQVHCQLAISLEEPFARKPFDLTEESVLWSLRLEFGFSQRQRYWQAPAQDFAAARQSIRTPAEVARDFGIVGGARDGVERD